jgi:hypothetical protein
MGAHTPGPWALGKGYGLHGVEVVGDNGNRMICGVIGVDRDVRDRDGRVSGSEQTAEGWANARLIAAAPELLGQHEADMVNLDLLAKAIHAGDPMPELVIRITDLLNRKRAVIALATGGHR